MHNPEKSEKIKGRWGKGDIYLLWCPPSWLHISRTIPSNWWCYICIYNKGEARWRYLLPKCWYKPTL